MATAFFFAGVTPPNEAPLNGELPLQTVRIVSREIDVRAYVFQPSAWLIFRVKQITLMPATFGARKERVKVIRINRLRCLSFYAKNFFYFFLEEKI